ncbi:magnesium chelatase subunit D family protein [Desulforhopalus vacuolatus]|uniref:magnesium chelatase subunit D family protein n=1 Tax=Desulforhopalus vacuolatus TaxID=40414 RepID=UPI001963FB25|nr:magnesium chelatase subunit D family protein [Desulforhopalus vacuolatus]MBM9520795.1 magnesium chelatase subunit D family protein [Desulforhopalus vacuolatus]
MSVYPFTALVGQEELKLGLLLNIVNPAVGGVVIRGEKGTAKSTAVRGLAELMSGAEGKPMPLINLPLNATEDMLAGSIDFQAALRRGEVVLQPGLMARADGGILYVDEVNLLDDHLVDIILDTAASGMNTVEREGISSRQNASFVLIGTMNPEEGELRPQLLDRFGLCVEMAGLEDIDLRVELLQRREAFDSAPQSFAGQYAQQSEQERQRILAARKKVQKLRLTSQQRGFIAELTRNNNVAGHRADLVLEQAAIACAALEGSGAVKLSHISRVAPLVLAHRMREAGEAPPEPPPPPEAEAEESSAEQNEQQTENDSPENREEPQQSGQKEQGEAQEERREDSSEQGEDENSADEHEREPHAPGGELIFEVGIPFKVKSIVSPKDRQARRGSGRRSRSRVLQKQGRYVKAAMAGGAGVEGDLALDATLRAAAPWQKSRRARCGASQLAIRLEPGDIRFKVREKRLGNLLLFVVDGSGSMGARGRMTASKGAIMSLLLDAYQKRDKVAMVSFRGREAVVNLPVTSSVELAGKMLAEMPVGGRTPLSAGLVKGYEVVRNLLVREPAARPIVIILTDGKANVSLGREKPVREMERLAAALQREERAHYIVVDLEEEGPVNFQLAHRLAGLLGAEYFKTGDLQAEELVKIVRANQG